MSIYTEGNLNQIKAIFDTAPQNSSLFYSPLERAESNDKYKKKESNAIASYANGVDSNDIIILFDDTVFGSAKEGFILTTTHIYWKELSGKPEMLPLSQINSASVKDKTNFKLYYNGDYSLTYNVKMVLMEISIDGVVAIINKLIEFNEEPELTLDPVVEEKDTQINTKEELYSQIKKIYNDGINDPRNDKSSYELQESLICGIDNNIFYNSLYKSINGILNNIYFFDSDILLVVYFNDIYDHGFIIDEHKLTYGDDIDGKKFEIALEDIKHIDIDYTMSCITINGTYEMGTMDNDTLTIVGNIINKIIEFNDSNTQNNQQVNNEPELTLDSIVEDDELTLDPIVENTNNVNKFDEIITWLKAHADELYDPDFDEEKIDQKLISAIKNENLREIIDIVDELISNDISNSKKYGDMIFKKFLEGKSELSDIQTFDTMLRFYELYADQDYLPDEKIARFGYGDFLLKKASTVDELIRAAESCIDYLKDKDIARSFLEKAFGLADNFEDALALAQTISSDDYLGDKAFSEKTYNATLNQLQLTTEEKIRIYESIANDYYQNDKTWAKELIKEHLASEDQVQYIKILDLASMDELLADKEFSMEVFRKAKEQCHSYKDYFDLLCNIDNGSEIFEETKKEFAKEVVTKFENDTQKEEFVEHFEYDLDESFLNDVKNSSIEELKQKYGAPEVNSFDDELELTLPPLEDLTNSNEPQYSELEVIKWLGELTMSVLTFANPINEYNNGNYDECLRIVEELMLDSSLDKEYNRKYYNDLKKHIAMKTNSKDTSSSNAINFDQDKLNKAYNEWLDDELEDEDEDEFFEQYFEEQYNNNSLLKDNGFIAKFNDFMNESAVIYFGFHFNEDKSRPLNITVNRDNREDWFYYQNEYDFNLDLQSDLCGFEKITSYIVENINWFKNTTGEGDEVYPQELLDLIEKLKSDVAQESSEDEVTLDMPIIEEPIPTPPNNNDLKQQYSQKIASGEIDPIETSFADFEAMSQNKEIDYKAVYSQMISESRIDPTETTYDEMIKVSKLFGGVEESEYKTTYSKYIASGEIDPSETTYDEIVNIANIFNEINGGISKGGAITKEQLIEELKSFIATIEDEDDKEYTTECLEEEDYWNTLEFMEDHNLKRKVFEYYESIARLSEEYNDIARNYQDDLDDIENSIKNFKLAEEKINSFTDALSIANCIVNEYANGDKNWARKVYEKAYTYAVECTDDQDLGILACKIADDDYGLGDKTWAREIFEKAYEKVTEIEGLRSIANQVMDEDYLDDKEWAKTLLQEFESKASTFDEIFDLMYSLDEDHLNNQSWHDQVVEKLRKMASNIEEYVKLIVHLSANKDVAIELVKEAVLLIQSAEEKEELSETTEWSLENEELANEIRESSIEDLKNKYGKPSTEELKKLYAAGIGDGSIDPVEVSFDSFVENYGVNKSSSSSNENYNELLMEAAQNNDVTLAQKCLDNGADVDYQTNDDSRTGMWTPLLYAAWDGHLEVGKLLVDNGANLKTEDRKGFKANDIAAGDCGYGNDGNQELSDYIWNAYVEKHGAWG